MVRNFILKIKFNWKLQSFNHFMGSVMKHGIAVAEEFKNDEVETA